MLIPLFAAVPTLALPWVGDHPRDCDCCALLPFLLQLFSLWHSHVPALVHVLQSFIFFGFLVAGEEIESTLQFLLVAVGILSDCSACVTFQTHSVCTISSSCISCSLLTHVLFIPSLINSGYDKNDLVWTNFFSVLVRVPFTIADLRVSFSALCYRIWITSPPTSSATSYVPSLPRLRLILRYGHSRPRTTISLLRPILIMRLRTSRTRRPTDIW